jgi:hypothetical protein
MEPPALNDQPIATRELNRGNQPGRRSPYSQAVDLQDRILEKAHKPDTTPLALSALARAWSELEDRKRILRGIPLPGQLRPDLDPEQLLKALKRARERKPFELTQGKVTFTETATDQPTKEPKAKVEAPKESLLPTPEGDHGGEGGGGGE